MAEWRLWSSWPPERLRVRLEQARTSRSSVDAVEEEMTGDRGWFHYHSEAVIAIERAGGERFDRARTALANYEFSDPRIVLAHFDPAERLLGRCMLLEIQVLGLHYLCPAIVNRVRDEPDVFGFRYDTLEGHLERGVEWFLLTRSATGEIRFRIEARWRTGEFPNWWSRAGFMVLSGYYQRKWHWRAHQRLSLLAHYGSTRRPSRDASGLTHQGVDVSFTYHTRQPMVPMNKSTLTTIMAVGALTGMRSMAGLATLAWGRGGVARPVMALAAAGEMLADKTSVVGDRIDPLPLAGRAVIGAVTGLAIAREYGQSGLLGGLIGAGTAVLAAHLAYHARRRLMLPGMAGGLIEDGLALAVASRYARGIYVARAGR